MLCEDSHDHPVTTKNQNMTAAKTLLTTIITTTAMACATGESADDAITYDVIIASDNNQPATADIPPADKPEKENSPEIPTQESATDNKADNGSTTGGASAYDLGSRCAQRLLTNCDTESAIRDELLDIRAREHSIRTQVSGKAADAYISGFRDALKESGDTLYHTLFE